MVLEFHEFPGSPFCRSVKMVAKLLDLQLESHEVNLFQKEQLTPEYRQKNPFHKVPTLNDNGFYLYESRPIMTYLIEKYGGEAGKTLYPKSHQQRALVDQMLGVDAGTLAPTVLGITRPLIFAGQQPTDESKEQLADVLGSLEKVLSKQEYVAGNTLTVADVAIRATVSLLEALNIVDLTVYKNFNNWTSRVAKQIPDYGEINDGQIAKLKAFIESKQKLTSYIKK